jgi:hypothetical protein
VGQGAGVDDKKQSAISVFGALHLKSLVGEQSLLKTLSLFGRTDISDPNTDAVNDKDGNTLIIAGVECTPIKGVAASVNFRSKGYQDSAKKAESYLYLNTEFKF